VLREERLLAVRDRWAAYLRPLLPAGLLLTILFVWLVATRGWSITVPPLGPGEGERYALQQLNVHYALPQIGSSDGDETEGEVASPPVALDVTAGEETATIPVDGRTSARVDAVRVRAAYGPPGLLVQSVDGAAELALPGQGARTHHVGLVFPEVGSEVFVLLPERAVALRILRGMDQTGSFFLIETFEGIEALDAGDVQPSSRMELRDDNPRTITLREGAVTLQLVPLPSLQVQVRYFPGVWLLTPALLLVIIGAGSYGWRPAFLVTQTAPWGAEQSVVVAQTNLAEEKALLADWLARDES
jgi:hypothetical protein